MKKAFDALVKPASEKLGELLGEKHITVEYKPSRLIARPYTKRNGAWVYCFKEGILRTFDELLETKESIYE